MPRLGSMAEGQMLAALNYEDSVKFSELTTMLHGIRAEPEDVKKQYLEHRSQVFPYLREQIEKKLEAIKSELASFDDRAMTISTKERKSRRMQHVASGQSPFKQLQRRSRRPR